MNPVETWLATAIDMGARQFELDRISHAVRCTPAIFAFWVLKSFLWIRRLRLLLVDYFWLRSLFVMGTSMAWLGQLDDVAGFRQSTYLYELLW